MNKNLLSLVLIVLAFGIYFTVTTKIMSQAKAVSAVNDQYKSAIESAKKLIAVRDQVLDDYNRISEADNERLSKMIPDTVDNIRLIIDLNNIALRHGFSLQSVKAVASAKDANMPVPASVGAPNIQPIPMVPNMIGASQSGMSINVPTLDSVNVSFSVTAPYLEFIGFLQDLESNLRLTDLVGLSMTTSDSGLYTYDVELRTYWLRQ